MCYYEVIKLVFLMVRGTMNINVCHYHVCGKGVGYKLEEVKRYSMVWAHVDCDDCNVVLLII